MRELRDYFRKNPQVLALLIICVVLGIGTFVAVLISLVSSGPGQITGEPSGAIVLVSSSGHGRGPGAPEPLIWPPAARHAAAPPKPGAEI
jgi:hypothetical protein